MNNRKPKVIAIGLDGATFRNLRPWMEQGLLPNLKFLVDNGISGELESTMPYVSSPAWSSFMTGVNPGKHGVFGFIKPFKDKSYKHELVSSADIKSKTIFEILSDSKKASVVINLPMTYPPFKINGFMIGCGLLTPNTGFDFTYPRDLFERAGFKKSEYVLDVNPVNYRENEKEKFFLDLIKCEEKRKEISFKLMESCDWNLCVLVFGGTDRLHHFYWHHIDPTHSKYNPQEAQRMLPSIINYYQKLDVIIGEFITHMDDNTSLFIISDHGFRPLEKQVALHKILEQNGLLHHRRESFLNRTISIQKRIRGILNRDSSLYRKMKACIKLPYHQIKNKYFKKIVSRKNVTERFSRGSSNNYWRKIDWQRTMAYKALNFNSIYLNIRNREPEGIVNLNGEYQRITNQIIELFNNLYEPKKYRKLNIKVYKNKNIYSGIYSKNGPDLFLEFGDTGYETFNGDNFKDIIRDSTDIHTGTHAKNGILICYGKNFKKAHKIEDAQIIDLAPTILYLLKDKIPEYMDGKVLKEALKNNYLGQNPIQHQKSLTEEQETRREYSAYSQEDGNKIKQRLAGLGYL